MSSLKILNNKRVLITGGTGSFGSTFLRNILQTKVKSITVYSRDEAKQFNLRNDLNDNRIRFVIGDIRDESSLDFYMSNIDFVFHAAALKQVPNCEFFPTEAVKTNVIGSKNVFETAINNNVQKVIALSTDKSVKPINAMGLSKALMEKIALSYAAQKDIKTKINIVRYGNVILSRGSVIPLFVEKIMEHKEVPVTSFEMTRFILSLQDSFNLVLLALNIGKSGEIFVKKLPATNIEVLLKSLERIFDRKIKTKLIGIRQGEKLHEELISQEEMKNTSSFKDYFIIKNEFNKNLNYKNYFMKGIKSKFKEGYNSANTTQINEKQLVKILLKERYISEKVEEYFKK